MYTVRSQQRPDVWTASNRQPAGLRRGQGKVNECYRPKQSGTDMFCPRSGYRYALRGCRDGLYAGRLGLLGGRGPPRRQGRIGTEGWSRLYLLPVGCRSWSLRAVSMLMSMADGDDDARQRTAAVPRGCEGFRRGYWTGAPTNPLLYMYLSRHTNDRHG